MRKKLNVFILVFCICLLMTGCFNKKEEIVKQEEKIIKAERISYSKLNEIVNNYDNYVDIDIVDVRSTTEFEDGHIKGAINIPYDELYDIIIDVNRETIIYADTATKSIQAATELINLGYKNVKYIAGINNWSYDLED